MCGIFCAVSATSCIWPSSELQERLNSRGPDSCHRVNVNLPNNGCITFCSTVLSLRGSSVVQQPLQSGDLTLCWNGEAWSIDDKVTEGNDTGAVLNLLTSLADTPANRSLDRTECLAYRAENVARLFSKVAGPYAFVLHDRTHDFLFYGRDFLGRRSLLRRTTADGDLVLSSVSDGEPGRIWEEVQADGVHFLDLLSTRCASSKLQDPALRISPYISIDECETYSAIPRLKLKEAISSSVSSLTETSESVSGLHRLLVNSLSLRVLSIPEVPNQNPSRSIDSADRSARLAVLFSGGLDCTVLARICHDLLPESEPIELLNVAFQNPRIHDKDFGPNDAPTEMYETCPDRATGRSSFKELFKVCPDREWRFVAVNVPFVETQAHRTKVISLMSPHNTEMDLSIALALYFASRGSGTMYSSTNLECRPYTASARVLLSGLGADELFGGYTRHATAFRRSGYSGLIEELNLDIGRLGTRNLGRDDRVLSHWGRETRFPFLDEQLLAWAVATPVQEKCGFGEISADSPTEPLEPGKRVLRCVAAKLGMKGVAVEKKRAIQFGARTAKMGAGKIKGTQQLEP